MMKKLLCAVLCVAMLLIPLSGMTLVTVSASNTQPTVTFNIAPYATISPNTTITVTHIARNSTTLTACDTRLEGTSIGTGASVSFTPAQHGLSDGVYTVVGQATDSAGVVTYEALTFAVSSSADLSYTVKDGVVSSSASVVTYAADALDFDVFYSSTTDGTLSLNGLNVYTEQNIYDIRYTGAGIDASSASGIPYQVFSVDLAGKTSGEVAISYEGSTLRGERIALKVYNPKTTAWDLLDTFTGSGRVSKLVDVATYKCGSKIYAAAVLDYVTNGSDTMIWSTDPQHYTKFYDLNEYYYKVYQYIADQYEAGEAAYAITTGDLVDDRPTAAVAPHQWSVSDKAMAYMDEVNMPYGLVSGNHDVADFKKPDYSGGPNTASNYSMFAKTFPASRYNTKPWYGGSLNNNTSHYDLITIGNIDFIVMYLGYGFEADDETIAWANDVLATYRHRTAIVTTHQYLETWIADYSPEGRGQLIYDKIVDPNPNVKMVLCGHDDGALCLEKTASDGRTVYEVLSDYQFVEAEDPSFYASEHYIGTVPHCCGDGYIRLMTVKGDTLESVTYSPITDRYNPYGDRENLSLKLNHTATTRTLNTLRFSAAVIGGATTDTTVDRVAVIGDGAEKTYSNVLYATTPAMPDNGAFRPAATPTATFFRQTPTATPTVTYKNNLLSAAGLQNGATVAYWQAYGNYSSSPLNFKIDLKKTPYLYYSFTQPADSNFTFSFINNMSTAPFLVFRDATLEGAALSAGNDKWNSYQNQVHYSKTTETGCIDMRDYVVDPNATTWEIEQLTFYNTMGQNVTINYMFFGSEDGRAASTLQASTDNTALKALISEASAVKTSDYTSGSVSELTAALEQANAAVGQRYYTIEPAYRRLQNALGALTPIKATVSESSLTSVQNYSLMLSNWTNYTVPKTTQHDDGFILANPAPTDKTWASIANSASYTVYPEQSKIYLKLDLDADSSWAMQLEITQNGKTGTVHLNNGIENGFNTPDADGMEGVFQGIYDVSDAFEMNGFDPGSTFTVNILRIYLVGKGTRADVRHIQFFTKASDGVTDKSNLQKAIARASLRTKAHYTSASWTTMQNALSAANTALSNTSLKESDYNLKAYALNQAVDALVYAGSFPETKGSLIPADPGLWKASSAGAITVSRPKNVTTIQNTNGQFPYMDYAADQPVRALVAESRLVADFTVGSYANIYLLVDNTFVSLIPYLENGTLTGDIPAGTYTLDIPLSEIAEFSGKSSITVDTVRVYSVGEAASSAVTLRTLRIAEYDDYKWDASLTTYGPAAKPSAPYFQHCAPIAPEVQNKVDILAAMGMDNHAVVSGWTNLTTPITIDLTKTPYLYYSVAIPEGGNFSFGFFNNTTYAPYFVFRDGTLTDGSLMNNGVPTWDGYTAGQQYLTKSETACIDLRTLTNDSSVTTWKIERTALYNSSGKDAIISYMFVGSKATYVEQNINIQAEEKPEEPVEPILMGDVNGDGKVTTFDARMVMTEILGATAVFTPEQELAADLTGDGKLSTSDVRMILLAALLS